MADADIFTYVKGLNIAGFDFGSDIQGKHNLTSAFGPVVALGKGNSDGAAQMQHFVQEGLNTFRLREEHLPSPHLLSSPADSWRSNHMAVHDQ